MQINLSPALIILAFTKEGMVESDGDEIVSMFSAGYYFD